MVTLVEAEAVLNEGLAQEESRAFWAKASMEVKTQPTCPLNRWHFLAANRKHEPAITVVKTHFKGEWKTSLDTIKTLTKGPLKKSSVQKNIIAEVQSFITTWDQIGYAKPLCELSHILKPLTQRNQAYLPVLQKAADLGDLKSQIQFATKQEELDDKHLLLQYRIKAARQKDIHSMNLLGDVFYLALDGQPANHILAAKYYLMAADENDAYGMFKAGTCFLPADEKDKLGMHNARKHFKKSEHDCPIDRKRAFFCFQHSHELGYSDATELYAYFLTQDLEGQRANPELALKILMPLAEKGNNQAKINIAVIIEKRESTADKICSRKYFSEAADEGFVPAMIYAGYAWEEDYKGEPSDFKKELQYYKKAAELDDEEGMHRAGHLYLKGFPGQAPDRRMALRYFLKAGDKGEECSLCSAGDILKDPSDKFTFDRYKAYQCFIKAAQAGCESAMFNAATYLQSRGRGDDEERALEFYLQSANQGYGPAMTNLALMYLDQTKKDMQYLKSALFWLEKATILNEPGAEKYLEIARQKVQEEQDKVETQLAELLEKSTQPIECKLHHDISEVDAKTETIQDQKVSSESSEEEEKVEEEKEVEEEGEEAATSTAASYTPHESYKKYNAKYMRNQLRELDKLEKERQAQADQFKLSEKEQYIADAIAAGDTQAIDHNALTTLFGSPFFQGQVEVTPTKKGIMVSAFNRVTKKYASASTHSKHNKTYKGAQPRFVKNLNLIVELFEIQGKPKGE